jgi:hypothetical protein
VAPSSPSVCEPVSDQPSSLKASLCQWVLRHLSYKMGTYEDHVGIRGLKRLGKKQWGRHVAFGVARLIDALHPDDVILGGGNAKKLTKASSWLPKR